MGVSTPKRGLCKSSGIAVSRGAARRGAPRARASRPGFVIAIAALILFVTAIIGFAINATGFLDTVYMDLTLTLPKFDYKIVDGQETGNTTFETFTQMRIIGAGIMGAAIIYAGVVRVLENESIGIVQRGISNQIITNSLMFVVLLLAFPPLWDLGADAMEDLAVWVLNPVYSFDEDRPCPDAWYEQDGKIEEEYNKSDYRTTDAVSSATQFLSNQDADSSQLTLETKTAEFVCEPGFKVRYVFNQMMGVTELNSVNATYGEGGIDFGQLVSDIQNFDSGPFVNIFLGLTKALITINVLITAFVIGIMADVLIGMIIAGLPMFLFLSLIPKAKKIADQFLEALPALFLLPVLSATVIVVGAGFLAGIGDDGSGDAETTLLYKWIAAIGVVFLAITLPVMIVGMLGRVSSIATQSVTTGIQTSAMITGMGVAGAAQGMKQGMAKSGGMGGLSRIATILGSGAAGLGHGLVSAAPQAAKSGGFDGANVAGDASSIGNAAEKEFKDAEGVSSRAGQGLRDRLGGDDGPPKGITGAPIQGGGAPAAGIGALMGALAHHEAMLGADGSKAGHGMSDLSSRAHDGAGPSGSSNVLSSDGTAPESVQPAMRSSDGTEVGPNAPAVAPGAVHYAPPPPENVGGAPVQPGDSQPPGGGAPLSMPPDEPSAGLRHQDSSGPGGRQVYGSDGHPTGDTSKATLTSSGGFADSTGNAQGNRRGVL